MADLETEAERGLLSALLVEERQWSDTQIIVDETQEAVRYPAPETAGSPGVRRPSPRPRPSATRPCPRWKPSCGASSGRRRP